MKEGLDDRENCRVDRERTDEHDKRRHHGVRQDAVASAPPLPFPGGHQCWRRRCCRHFTTPAVAGASPVTGERAPMRCQPPISLGHAKLLLQPPRLETCEPMALIALATLSWPAGGAMQVGVDGIAERRVPGGEPGREDRTRVVLGQVGELRGTRDLTGGDQLRKSPDVGRQREPADGIGATLSTGESCLVRPPRRTTL